MSKFGKFAAVCAAVLAVFASFGGTRMRVGGGADAKASGVYDVRAYGAKGDGIAKDTVAVQSAIDAAGAAGGGEVVVPAGRYLCGTLYLKSNVDVNLASGATIEGSKDPDDYNKWDFCPQNGKSSAENTSGGHLIVCLEQTNVVLRGAGTIDGN